MRAKQSGKISDAFELVLGEAWSGGEEEIRQSCLILDLLDALETDNLNVFLGAEAAKDFIKELKKSIEMKIQFKKLNEYAVAPQKAHDTDAGFDLTATYIIGDGESSDTITCGTDIAVSIPEGYVGLLCSRSSIYKYDLIQNNSVGIIDSGYHGELIFKFRKQQPFINSYKVGDRIGQLVIVKLPEIEFEQVEEFEESSRGKDGFGSTGR